MKNNLPVRVLMLALFACTVSHAAPVATTPLVGKWHSDRKLTMDYFRKTVKTNSDTMQFLEGTTGRMTLEFTRDRAKADLPAFSFNVDTSPVHMPASHVESPYKVVSASAKAVSISITEKGKTSTKTYNFDGKDTIWVATAGAPPREYFTRVH
jgi:hypothetical protein